MLSYAIQYSNERICQFLLEQNKVNVNLSYILK